MSSGPMLPSTPEVPGYEFVKPLGRGAMGVVVLARQLRLGRPVAIKFLSIEDEVDPGPRAHRFRREAELMARISHPNILAIHDYGEIDGRPYLVMDYVEGGDLRRLMRPGRAMPTSQAASVLFAVGEALTHLHKVGILHRDLKPENILMHDGDHPKVADFGLAVMRAGRGSLTETREGIGTYGYVAPEQRYRLRVDERADQYSLAALGYELLTGECPVGIIRPPSELNHRIRRSVDLVLLRALQDDPDDRYPTVSDFLAALRLALRPTPARSSASGRNRLSWIGAGLVIAGTTLLLGGIWFNSKHARTILADGQAEPVTRTVTASPPVDRAVEQDIDASGTAGVPFAPSRSRLNVLGMRMIALPSGTFLMGSTRDDPLASEDEFPQRPVKLSRPFWMAAHEVTIAQFRRFVEETMYETVAERDGGRVWDQRTASVRLDPGLNWRNPGYDQPPGDDHPVVQVARADAEEFCRWLSRRDGVPYRLPTEAEWEYACRAGSTTRWSMGDDPGRLGEFAWYRVNSSWTLQAVGGKRPNPWGLFDLHGNARELCSDWYDRYPSTPGAATPEVDPTGPEKGYRWVVRGGSWDSIESESQTRSAARSHKVFPYFTVGFRVCHDEAIEARSPVAHASGIVKGP